MCNKHNYLMKIAVVCVQIRNCLIHDNNIYFIQKVKLNDKLVRLQEDYEQLHSYTNTVQCEMKKKEHEIESLETLNVATRGKVLELQEIVEKCNLNNDVRKSFVLSIRSVWIIDITF